MVDINFSSKAKLNLVWSMMGCLYANCIPWIADCVMAETEKLGQNYPVTLRIAKDPRLEQLSCTNKGTCADDCLIQRVTAQVLHHGHGGQDVKDQEDLFSSHHAHFQPQVYDTE